MGDGPPQLFNQKQTQLSCWREKVKNKTKRKLVLTDDFSWLMHYEVFEVLYRLPLSDHSVSRSERGNDGSFVALLGSRMHICVCYLPIYTRTSFGPLLRLHLSIPILHSVPVNLVQSSVCNTLIPKSREPISMNIEHSNVRILYLAFFGASVSTNTENRSKYTKSKFSHLYFSFFFFVFIYCVSFLCPHDSVCAY